MSMKSRVSWIVFIQRVMYVLATCALMGMYTSVTSAAPADNNAFVRVVHAAPGAANVDVFVDGTALLSNFAFSTVSNYVPLPAGSHTIKVAPAGQGIAAAVITDAVVVTAGVPYTVAALGTNASTFQLQTFVDDNTAIANMAKVRVYHLSPNAGPVNVAASGVTVISGLTYPNASAYLPVPPGTYTFNVTATQANATVPVTATLKAGTVNSVFAVGLFKGQPPLTFVQASVAATADPASSARIP